ncbi:hypothetical protein B0H63DRAFT_542397 [Podospora didyma]|uniref:DUF7689 domain-containing protein n=1 Tax=Podospora didyma TaxID=330526 RepID=A0AAE0U1V4_9PEZI|nr:hypothetical protein B0H63DRAFT_542397 [Podospora didyma]
MLPSQTLSPIIHTAQHLKTTSSIHLLTDSVSHNFTQFQTPPTNIITMSQPAFAGVIHEPRAPTKAEQEKLVKRWPKLATGGFRVIGEASTAYNCLGWAVGVKKDAGADNMSLFGGAPSRRFRAGAKQFEKDPADDWFVEPLWAYMAEHGFEPTANKAEAVIDVYGVEKAPVGRFPVLHFSLKLGTKWTSKVSKDGLCIEHERGALESAEYGTVLGYYKRKAAATAGGSSSTSKGTGTGSGRSSKSSSLERK